MFGYAYYKVEAPAVVRLVVAVIAYDYIYLRAERQFIRTAGNRKVVGSDNRAFAVVEVSGNGNSAAQLVKRSIGVNEIIFIVQLSGYARNEYECNFRGECDRKVTASYRYGISHGELVAISFARNRNGVTESFRIERQGISRPVVIVQGYRKAYAAVRYQLLKRVYSL